MRLNRHPSILLHGVVPVTPLRDEDAKVNQVELEGERCDIYDGNEWSCRALFSQGQM